MWPELSGSPASLCVRSWRREAMSWVREELERALDVRFVDCDDKIYDGAEAYQCVLPACELRLNSWPSGARGIAVFQLIGLEATEPARDLSVAIATHLGFEWYVPDRLEHLEDVLGQPDKEVIVAILGPRWLSACSVEERAEGVELLRIIVERWLQSSRRMLDPAAELLRHRRAFEERSVAATGRLELLRKMRRV